MHCPPGVRSSTWLAREEESENKKGANPCIRIRPFYYRDLPRLESVDHGLHLHFGEFFSNELKVYPKPGADIQERVEVVRVFIVKPFLGFHKDFLTVNRFSCYISSVALDGVFQDGQHELLFPAGEPHASVSKVVLGRMNGIDFVEFAEVFLELF